jgi:hypothetical protein
MHAVLSSIDVDSSPLGWTSVAIDGAACIDVCIGKNLAMAVGLALGIAVLVAARCRPRRMRRARLSGGG